MSDFDELFGDSLVSPADEAKPEVPEAFTPTGIEVFLDSEIHKFSPNENLWKYGKAVLDTRENEATIKISAAGIRAKRTELAKQEQALRDEFSKRLQELMDARSEIDADIWEADKADRAAQREVKNAEQALRDAMIAERNRRAFMEKSIGFDEITAGLSWREWALQHQLEGAKFLAIAKRGILADKMGLGKTLTSLIWADMLKIQKLLVIVPDDVASNFVNEIRHWAPHRDVIRVGKRNKVERDMIFNLMLPAVSQYTVVVNYSAWRKDKSVLDKLIDCRFEAVIMDEAHTIKNIRTAAYKGCEKIVLADNSCPECRGRIQAVRDEDAPMTVSQFDREFLVCVGEYKTTSVRLPLSVVNMEKSCGWTQKMDRVTHRTREYGSLRSVRNIITMTGTPILNKPTDIFAMLKLIDDKTYHSERDFIWNYCATDYSGKTVFRPGGMESLVKRLSGVYIGRDRKSAGVVLPKQEVQIHELEFDTVKYADQYRVIKQLTKHAAIILSSGKELSIPAIIALITRKRQANVWPAGIEIKDPETGLVEFSVSEDVNESMKLDYIIERPATSESGEWEGIGYEITGEGDRTNGERMVIFSQFKTPLAELEKRFKEAGISVVRFDGDTPQEIRDEVKIDFDRKFTPGDDYKWQVVLCNYRTGGVGLNFTAATQMIVLDEEWNPGKRDQAYGRVDRIGQTEETTVHVLRLMNSIDGWLASLIQNKEDMINDFENSTSMQSAFLDFLNQENI